VRSVVALFLPKNGQKHPHREILQHPFLLVARVLRHPGRRRPAEKDATNVAELHGVPRSRYPVTFVQGIVTANFGKLCPVRLRGRAAAAATFVVVDDSSSTVQLEMAAGQEHIAQLLPGALYP